MAIIEVRPGSLKYIDFIITCIIEAEKAGTKYSSYERIFEIEEIELRSILKNILLEEIPGCELYCDNYFLAFVDNTPIGGVGAWIEGTGMKASNAIRANNFSYYIKGRWKDSQENLKLISKYEIPRTPGIMQLEDSYVLPSYHGYRVIEKIFVHAINEFTKKYPLLKLAQGFTLAGNIQSLISMTKMQWKQSRKVMFDNDVANKLLPGTGKIQWELDLTDPDIIGKSL